MSKRVQRAVFKKYYKKRLSQSNHKAASTRAVLFPRVDEEKWQFSLSRKKLSRPKFTRVVDNKENVTWNINQ